VRVITGKSRGKKLLTLKGNETRPTTDRVKESIFNIIQFDIEGRRTLDLFAGTGQLGIEALSRGAKSCVFVDSSPESAEIVKKNLKDTGFSEQSRILRMDFTSYLGANSSERFGLIFLDPPYGGDLLNRALKLIIQFDILTPGGIIICESARKDVISDTIPPYKRRDYLYGSTKISIIGREGG
jgi:16S rRNA (guanine(966)-N(2))-methyltransferase RsmD